MEDTTKQLYDMDHVLMPDGKIYRILGNFKSDDKAFGYNLYSPAADGDRTFRGERYVKNYKEEATQAEDVLSTYDILNKKDIVEFFDPISTAQERMPSFEGTIWSKLYDELVQRFGKESIGIFGSALPGLHLAADGSLKNDVDFFIEGVSNVPVLSEQLSEVREDLGFTDYDPYVQQEIRNGWKKVFRNPHTSFDKILDRRWSGMQLTISDSNKVLNTFRFRDKSILTSLDLVNPANIVRHNVQLSGVVSNAVIGNLYPRMFTVSGDGTEYEVYSLWWKFSSPVLDDDSVTVCGNLVTVEGKEVLVLTNYVNHYIQIQ
jgi:predicted nucleotidyltransferase